MNSTTRCSNQPRGLFGLALLAFVSLTPVAVAEGRISQERARQYATEVNSAIRLITDHYVRAIPEKDLLRWGIEGLHRRAEVPVPETLAKRLVEDEDLAPQEVLIEVRRQLGARKALEDHHDVEATVKAMLAHLDPRSTYVDPKSAARNRKFDVNHTSQVGLYISRTQPTDACRIVGTVKDGPAYRAGIHDGDVLQEVHLYEDAAGKPLESPRVVTVKDVSDSALNELLAGRAGARVDLVVTRDALERPLTFALQFEVLRFETLLGVRRRPDASWDYLVDAKRRIAYLRIPSFYSEKTTLDLALVLEKLAAGDVQGIVLDLRGNPGGRIAEGFKVCELLVPADETVVELQGRGRNNGKVRSKNAVNYSNIPLVCLVDHKTASAAELVAACLQDLGRATIVGERTFGKGSMQVRYPLHGGELRLTTAYLLRPRGTNLDREHLTDRTQAPWGVRPDTLKPLSAKEHTALESYLAKKTMVRAAGKDAPYHDVQLEAALAVLRGEEK